MIGLGRFGANLGRTLVASGHTVLGIDSDATLVQRYANEMTQTVRLDSTDEEALREIDIASYPTVVVAIGSNLETSILTVVAVRSVGVKTVVAKATTTTGRDVLLRVGADRVVLPEHDGGHRLAEELANPGLVGMIPLGANDCVTELRTPVSFVGLTISQINLPEKYGAWVVAMVREGKTLVPAPTELALRSSDILVLVGPTTCVSQIANHA